MVARLEGLCVVRNEHYINFFTAKRVLAAYIMTSSLSQSAISFVVYSENGTLNQEANTVELAFHNIKLMLLQMGHDTAMELEFPPKEG